jgi:outer membrane receptor for ferrienterochelin and colicins
MRLKLISDLDPRRSESPWWSIQNIQLVYSGFKRVELYGGVKNLLNWTPAQGNPFLIARTNDPFDKDPTGNNPYGLKFDPDYNYAPNQGIRGFLGVRMSIK